MTCLNFARTGSRLYVVFVMTWYLAFTTSSRTVKAVRPVILGKLNVSQCTSSTNSEENALNCTVHKISLCLLLISWSNYYLIAIIVTSCQSLLYSFTESGKCVKGLLIWTSHLKFKSQWCMNGEHNQRWRDLLTWHLLLSDFIRFLTFKRHFCESLLTQWYNGLLLHLIWGFQKIL